MYQPYPTGGPGQPPLMPPTAPPPSMLNAVKLMYAGAVLSGIEIIVGFVLIAADRSLIHKEHPNLTTTQVHQAVIAFIIAAVVIGLIGIGLWIFMAKANQAGKSWARIVASVLFALYTLDLLNSFRDFQFSLILGILTWLAGLGAIIFLYRQDSSAYYQANKMV
jgi:hypothetical protein